MIPKTLEQITVDDLNTLVTNQMREGKTMEYKQEFPKGDDRGVVRFLAGTSAMANTGGGDFLIGVEADDGVAVDIPGILLSNLDETELRLENWLRTGLEPRLPRYEIRSVPIDDAGQYVIVVRVHQSWIAPHRVTYKGHDKFYGRNSAGKYPLDVSELRTAFTLSEQISTRIRDFRVERIAAIAGNEAPVLLSDKGKVVMHLIPLSAFTSRDEINTVKCYQEFHQRGKNPLPTPDDHQGQPQLTLEGLLVTNSVKPPDVSDYTLLFRSGVLETVSSFLPGREEKLIPSKQYERALLSTLPYYLHYLKALEIKPPLYLFLTLINVQGYQLHIDEQLRFYRDIDMRAMLRKDIVPLPEIVLETLDLDDARDVLRPLFDLVWNAFGHLRSFNFGEDGQWQG